MIGLINRIRHPSQLKHKRKGEFRVMDRGLGLMVYFIAK